MVTSCLSHRWKTQFTDIAYTKGDFTLLMVQFFIDCNKKSIAWVIVQMYPVCAILGYCARKDFVKKSKFWLYQVCSGQNWEDEGVDIIYLAKEASTRRGGTNAFLECCTALLSNMRTSPCCHGMDTFSSSNTLRQAKTASFGSGVPSP